MAVDYLILKHCRVKEQLSTEQLLERIKNRNRVYNIRDMLAQSGKTEDEINNFEFTHQQWTPNGPINSRHKIIDLIAEISILDTLAPICTDCPVANKIPFGCIGAVNYPISAKCEQWLAQIALESYKKGEVYSTMIKFILDQKVTGKETEEARRHGDTFFELKHPIEIVLSKSFFSKKIINTSQLIDMILGIRSMQYVHMNHLLMLFGGIFAEDTQPKDRPSKFHREISKYVSLGLDLPNDPDQSIYNFYWLFHKMFLAFINDTDMAFDR